MPVGIESTRDLATSAAATLAENIVSIDHGVWVGVGGLEKKSIEFIITGTATAQVFVSNLPTQPANADDHIKYGNDVVASALVEIKIPVRWMKIKVPSINAGASVSAYMQGCP